MCSQRPGRTRETVCAFHVPTCVPDQNEKNKIPVQLSRQAYRYHPSTTTIIDNILLLLLFHYMYPDDNYPMEARREFLW